LHFTCEAGMTAEIMDIADAESAVIHPAWVRVCHWINALAVLTMIGSGWQIYDASPLFGFTFPKRRCGSW
jgi:thiosulfate reductase cytochrome b subunit